MRSKSKIIVMMIRGVVSLHGHANHDHDDVGVDLHNNNGNDYKYVENATPYSLRSLLPPR